MRSLNDEKGAVAVTVALLMVVLLGFAALAIDVSALYQERRTLQNGADAGALAVAKDCASTGCVDVDVDVIADDYADENADDGESNVDEVCGPSPGLIGCPDPPAVPAGTVGYVRVTTSTNEVTSPGNPTEVNFNFAPVFDLVAPGDHEGKTMRASAVAAWGPPRAATTGPLTISLCEFERIVRPRFPGSLLPPGILTAVHFHGLVADTLCLASGLSSARLPGGFGWLDVNADCEVTVEVGEWADADPFDRAPNCLDVDDLIDTTVIVPIHDDSNGPVLLPGTPILRAEEFRIAGFAAFHVTDYQSSILDFDPLGICLSLFRGCLEGFFTTSITTGPEFGGPDMGVNIIKLVG
jgi:hypothetical protein